MSPTALVQREPQDAFAPSDPFLGEEMRGWPDVRIEQVTVEPVLADRPDGPRRVAAVVRLGVLTPADVVVSLMPVSRDPEAAVRTREAVRLWSVLPYHNGAYRFETEVEEARLRGPERLKLHVGPPLDQLTTYTRGTPSGCWHLLPPESADPDA